MDKKYIELVEAIGTALWYNGYENCIIELRDKIKEFNNSKKDKYDTFYMPPFDLDFINEHEQFHLFTMFLVLLYGDYGTSPRFGWICAEKAEECIEFLNIIIERNSRDFDYIILRKE